jgi:hypothetical protein
MHPGQIGEAAASSVDAPPTGSMDGSLSIVGQVHCGLNLFLPLKNRTQMPALMATVLAVQSNVTAALRDLHYVHFARFLPALDGSALMVITVFDGAPVVADDANSYNDSMKSYLMDFVAVIGDEFTAILDFVEGAPRLPVKRYPREFVQFVIDHNLQINPFSAYPEMTVIDVIRARGIR